MVDLIDQIAWLYSTVYGGLFLVEDKAEGQDLGEHLRGEHHHEHDLQLFLQEDGEITVLTDALLQQKFPMRLS